LSSSTKVMYGIGSRSRPTRSFARRFVAAMMKSGAGWLCLGGRWVDNSLGRLSHGSGVFV
jgi:hypothetical protein